MKPQLRVGVVFVCLCQTPIGGICRWPSFAVNIRRRSGFGHGNDGVSGSSKASFVCGVLQ